MKAYQHKNNFATIVGTTTEESMLRKQGWLRTGCNAYNNNKSQPLSFWKEQDILRYIKENNLKIASIYGDIISVDDNGGEYYKPHVVKQIQDENRNVIENKSPVLLKKTVSEETSRQIRTYMKQTMTTGTGKRAQKKRLCLPWLFLNPRLYVPYLKT